jgi:hypothetical protein
MSSERIAYHKQKLTAARAHLDRILDAAAGYQQVQVYSDGAAWNVHQLAVHLADAEVGNLRQLQGIASGQSIIPEDFDLDRYNKRAVEKRAEITFEQARAQLAESRAALLAWLDTIDDSVLQRVGRHATLNVFSIDQILRIMAMHERDHANDIARVLGLPRKP